MADASDELITLDLKPVADPLTRQGLPARDAVYRLKLALKTLLRAHGLKCVRVRFGAEEVAITPEADEKE